MTHKKSKTQSVVFDGTTTEVLVRKRTGGRIVGSFSAISPLSNKKRNPGRMQPDIFDLLDQVSKGAFSVFNNLKFNRSEETNLTKFEMPGEMSKTDREVHSRRISELKKVGLIRSVKKEMPDLNDPGNVHQFNDPRKTFVINPNMIKCQNHKEAMHLWDNCNH